MMLPDLGQNLVAMFERSAARQPHKPFLWAKVSGAYRPWSRSTVANDVQRLARALAALGVRRGDRVAIIAESRPEWCIADLAIMAAGGVSVPSYTTYTAEDYAYVLGHSGAKGVIAGGQNVWRRLLPAIQQSPEVEFSIVMDCSGEATGKSRVLEWGEALALGDHSADALGSQTIDCDDLACFIYTSGTGGRPKGVMLTHRNIMANLRGVWHLLEEVGLGEEEVFLSFLPLSHAYEHTAGQFLPIAMGAQIYYSEGVEQLSRNLTEVRPSILPCVPRLFEVLRQRIVHAVQREGGIRKWMFDRALALGAKRYEAGGKLPPHEALLDALLQRTVREKVKERFGGRLKVLVSGGAPLNYEVGLFFTALGVPVLQGYGQTEASPVISVNPPGRSRLDTVGLPLKGVEVKVAQDGEILVRGELVMKGYWKDPEATAVALKNGWLHTGDVGLFDNDGYLKITDRKKDIIVNSGGDNLSPQRVEGTLLLDPDIAQAIVYGDRKPHLVALIVPSQELLRESTHAPASSAKKAASGEASLVQERIGEAVKRANHQLSAIERIRRFKVLPEPFSVENGLLTPTLKMRRSLVYQRYRELFESLYDRGK